MTEYDPLGLVNTAAEAFDRRARVNDERNFAEEQRQKPLSGYEKWLGKMLSGELSPEHAAIGAQLEQAGHPDFQAQPDFNQSITGSSPYVSPQVGPGSQMTQAQGLASALPVGSGGPAMPSQAPAMTSMPPRRMAQQQGLSEVMGPENRGDFQSMVSVAPLIKGRKGLTDNELAFKIWQENQRTDRSKYGVDTRAETAKADQERKTQEFAQTAEYKTKALQQQWQITLAKLQAYQRVASMRTGSSEKIMSARIAVTREGNQLKAIAQDLMSTALLSGNQQAVDFANKLNAEVDSHLGTINQVLNEKMKSGGTLPTEAKSESSKKPVYTEDSLNAAFDRK